MDVNDVARQKDILKGREPKLLYLDLEISPALIYAYGAYDVNALKIKVPPKIVSFAYQWEGEKKIHCKILPDYPGYKPGILKLDDKKICEELYDVMDEADALVGHNFKKFDLKQAKARFFFHKMLPTKKWKVEDTLFMARKYFAFIKNNLDYLSEEMEGEGKTKLKHSDLIWGCLEGNMADWEAMRKYNKKDIVLTRNRYVELAPWHETHFNANLITRSSKNCPNPACMSSYRVKDDVQKNKFNIKQRYRCMDCGKRWVGEIIAQAPKKETVETQVERVDQFNV